MSLPEVFESISCHKLLPALGMTGFANLLCPSFKLDTVTQAFYFYIRRASETSFK